MYIKMDKGWNKYARHGITLILIDHGVQFEPTKHHRPTTTITLSNHKIYYRFSTTCKVLRPKTIPPPRDWEELIQQQPPWIKQLVRSITFDDLTTVINHITSDVNLIAVSDGSAKQIGMTYGWVIATKRGTMVATGNGPSDGRPSSMRSEGQGMLAVLLFLAMIQQFTNSKAPIRIEFMSDNQELINRQTNHKEYNIPYPNATLKAEFDLTEQIYHTHIDYNI